MYHSLVATQKYPAHSESEVAASYLGEGGCQASVAYRDIPILGIEAEGETRGFQDVNVQRENCEIVKMMFLAPAHGD